MVRYGMPALVGLDTVEETAALCARLGLGFAELNTNFPSQQLHLLDPEQVKKLAKEHGIFFTVHLNDEMPVADFNPIVAKGYRDAVLEAIEFAKKSDISLLNMHISEGARYTMPDRKVYFYGQYRQAYLEGIRLFRDVCTEAIGASGIRICMENSKAYHDFQKEALDLLLESDAFALTLDIGHSHCSGYADEDWILARKARLRHLHIHDARDGTQDHLPLGEGVLSLPRYLSIAEECSCTAVLEVKTAQGLEQSVQWLHQNKK